MRVYACSAAHQYVRVVVYFDVVALTQPSLGSPPSPDPFIHGRKVEPALRNKQKTLYNIPQVKKGTVALEKCCHEMCVAWSVASGMMPSCMQ